MFIKSLLFKCYAGMMNLEKEIADLKRTIENKQRFINRILEEKKEMSKEITTLIKENQKLRSPAHLKTELAKVRKIKKTIQEMQD